MISILGLPGAGSGVAVPAGVTSGGTTTPLGSGVGQSCEFAK